MSNTPPQFAMPIGLPADPLDAATQFAGLHSRLEAEINTSKSFSAWVVNDPVYTGVHAMVRGLLVFVPAGRVDAFGRTATTPTLMLKVWIVDYLKLKKFAGSVAPKLICYRNLDVTEVTNAVRTLIAASPSLAGRAATLLPQLMAGQGSLLVKAGAVIGRGAVEANSNVPSRVGRRRVDIEFQDESGAALNPGESIGCWQNAGGALVNDHPLLDAVGLPCFPAVAPVEGRTWIRLSLRTSGSAVTRVTVGGVDAFNWKLNGIGTRLYVEVPPRPPGTFNIEISLVGGTSQTYASVLRYVDDLDEAVHAVAASRGVALEVVEESFSTVPSDAVLSEGEVIFAEDIADFSGRRLTEALAARAAATNRSLLDPALQAIEREVLERTASRAGEVMARIGKIATTGGPSLLFLNLPITPGFFSQVRSLMDANRGLIAVRDGSLNMVCADATFYRFRVLDRPVNRSMSEAMYDLFAAKPSVRAAVNGQYFLHPTGERGTYFKVHPSLPRGGKSIPFGQQVVNGSVINGWPLVGEWLSHADQMKGFGQLDGRGEAAFVLADTLPGAVTGGPTSPGPFRDAMSVKVIIKNKKFVPSYIGIDGRNFWGIHRASNTFFFLGGTFDFVPTQELLISLGVDDAITADGGSSLMMMVDDTWIYNHAQGINLVRIPQIPVRLPAPHYWKDYSNPMAAYLQLESLVGSNGSAEVNPATTHSAWVQTSSIRGVSARIGLTDGGQGLSAGTVVIFDSLGAEASGGMRNVAGSLNISLPLTLWTSQSDITTAQRRLSLAGAMSGNISALLRLEPTATTDGRMTGRIDIQTAQGLVVLDVVVPLATAP